MILAIVLIVIITTSFILLQNEMNKTEKKNKIRGIIRMYHNLLTDSIKTLECVNMIEENCDLVTVFAKGGDTYYVTFNPENQMFRFFRNEEIYPVAEAEPYTARIQGIVKNL